MVEIQQALELGRIVLREAADAIDDLLPDLSEARLSIRASIRLGAFDESFQDLVERLRVHEDRLGTLRARIGGKHRRGGGA
jgi:hypothetical protein